MEVRLWGHTQITPGTRGSVWRSQANLGKTAFAPCAGTVTCFKAAAVPQNRGNGRLSQLLQKPTLRESIPPASSPPSLWCWLAVCQRRAPNDSRG
eukprot:3055591-Pyramimonas_sp.AAC.1